MHHVNVNTTRRTRAQQTSALEAVQHGTHMPKEFGGSNYSERSCFLTIAHGLLCLSVEKNPSPCFFSPNCWGCGGGWWTSLGIPKAALAWGNFSRSIWPMEKVEAVSQYMNRPWAVRGGEGRERRGKGYIVLWGKNIQIFSYATSQPPTLTNLSTPLCFYSDTQEAAQCTDSRRYCPLGATKNVCVCVCMCACVCVLCVLCMCVCICVEGEEKVCGVHAWGCV